MFKSGDRVVCINNSHLSSTTILSLNKNYEIQNSGSSDNDYDWVSLENIYYYEYNAERFISIKEYRKLKIKQLESCSNQEIK